MRISGLRLITLGACLGLLLGTSHASTKKKTAGHSAKATASHRATHGKQGHKARKNQRARGQQAMKPERVREIQAALIREKFLDGEPTGVWDQRSKDAMSRYQSSNGWQSKVVPDARALIKLGLGPDHADLINPETAATSTIPGGGTASNAPLPLPSHE